MPTLVEHRLLFDQNISHRLINKIAHTFSNAYQVRQLGLENASDLEIWQYAQTENFTIVTFDADFYTFSQFYGFPPKIIWLRFGNTNTSTLQNILLAHAHSIENFISDERLACLQINQPL